ncbi:unnamed protein product [Parnassius mnemosyne]|uniref:RNA-directed DNA polymerase n=1 Tax=Parnassius mnemosyne TaxID=213953 RepID=A0AAV1LII1_9NEOP
MLKELHDTHLGIIKTKSNARSRMWWPGIDRDIERWIGSCKTCVSLRCAPPRDPPAPWPAAAGAWQRVHIDYMTVGQRVYLVVVDSFSKWLECIFMNSGTSSQSLIKKLKNIFSTFGIPNVLVSDNDVKINSNEFKTFCSNNGIKYLTSPIYHPPSNGQAENSVRTCKKMLKCILKDNLPQHQINEVLWGYLFNYRNTVHCTTGETPAKLMFGRNLRSRLDLIIPIEKTQLNMPLVTSRRFFEIGDTVWARWYSARKETWELGTIKEKVGSKMYKIFIIKFEATCIRHIDQLLKFTGNDNSLKINNTDNVESRNFQSLPLSPSMPVNAPLSEPSVGNPRSSTIVEQPVNTDAIDDVNGEEWGDYSAQDSVRDSTEIPEASDSPEASENGVEQPQSDSVRSNDVPPEQAPTPARQLRPRKGIDYKKYFK